MAGNSQHGPAGMIRPDQQSSLAAIRADITQGMADVNAGHISKMDMAAIKSQGRALKKTS